MIVVMYGLFLFFMYWYRIVLKLFMLFDGFFWVDFFNCVMLKSSLNFSFVSWMMIVCMFEFVCVFFIVCLSFLSIGIVSVFIGGLFSLIIVMLLLIFVVIGDIILGF